MSDDPDAGLREIRERVRAHLVRASHVDPTTLSAEERREFVELTLPLLESDLAANPAVYDAAEWDADSLQEFVAMPKASDVSAEQVAEMIRKRLAAALS